MVVPELLQGLHLVRCQLAQIDGVVGAASDLQLLEPDHAGDLALLAGPGGGGVVLEHAVARGLGEHQPGRLTDHLLGLLVDDACLGGIGDVHHGAIADGGPLLNWVITLRGAEDVGDGIQLVLDVCQVGGLVEGHEGVGRKEIGEGGLVLEGAKLVP